MGSSTRDLRNSAATTLLNYGFANYALYHADAKPLGDIKVVGGENATVGATCKDISLLVKKSEAGKITFTDSIPESVSAPVGKGEKIGERSYYSGETLLGKSDIVLDENVKRIGFWGVFGELLAKCAIF